MLFQIDYKVYIILNSKVLPLKNLKDFPICLCCHSKIFLQQHFKNQYGT